MLDATAESLVTADTRQGNSAWVTRAIFYFCFDIISENALTLGGIPCNIPALLKSWKPLWDLGFGCF